MFQTKLLNTDYSHMPSRLHDDVHAPPMLPTPSNLTQADAYHGMEYSGDIQYYDHLDLETLEAFASVAMPAPTLIYIVDGILQVILIVIGCIGGIVTIPIYSRPQVWSCFNYYLIALAVMDTVLLLSYFFATALWVIVFGGNVKTYGWHIRTVQAAFVFCHTSLSATIWFTTLLTIERFFAVCYPLWHIRGNRDRRIRISILLTSALAIVYNLMKTFEFETYEVKIEELFSPAIELISSMPGMANHSLTIDNQTVTVLAPSSLYDSVRFQAYRFVCKVVFDSVVPVVVIGVLTARMCWALFKAGSRRSTYLGNNSSHRVISSPNISVASAPVVHRSSTCHFVAGRESLPLPPSPPAVFFAEVMPPLDIKKHSSAGQLPGIIKYEPITPSSRRQTNELVRQYSSPPYSEQHCLLMSGGGKGLTTRRSSPGATKRLNAPLTLLLVKFIISHTLPAIITIVEIIDKQHMHGEEMGILTTVSNFLVVFNSATNWCVFLLCGKRFRLELKHFCSCFMRKFTLEFVAKAKTSRSSSAQSGD